uniref:Uncharacterized protein n=1 Tax=Ixodes ricinus TaxID=34613 RepID=A0A6B0U4K0_IXORI
MSPAAPSSSMGAPSLGIWPGPVLAKTLPGALPGGGAVPGMYLEPPVKGSAKPVVAAPLSITMPLVLRTMKLATWSR